jgi:hypothetical protein
MIRAWSDALVRATVSFGGADRDAVLSAMRLYAREPGRRYAMGTAAEGGTLRAEVAPDELFS